MTRYIPAARRMRRKLRRTRPGGSLSGGRAFSHGRRRSSVSPRASRELVVGNQDQPCPPVGLLRCARPGAGETQCLLEKPEGVLDIETAEIGAPQQRQLDGGGIWVTEPQPQWLWCPIAGEQIGGHGDDRVPHHR